MSVFRDPRSPFWRYDFQWRGHRFFGSTKAKSKREAEAVERGIREQSKQQVAQAQAAATSLRLDDVAGRYWNEVGQHHVNDADTWRQIEKLIEFLGKDKIITEIIGDDVAKLVAWRRGHRVRKGRLISPYTVNDTTEQLKKLFTRAKLWGRALRSRACMAQALAGRTAGACARIAGRRGGTSGGGNAGGL
jgi:hypothetical protein